MELGVDRALGLPLRRRIQRRLRLTCLRLLQRAIPFRLILPNCPVELICCIHYMFVYGWLLGGVESLREAGGRLRHHLLLQRSIRMQLLHAAIIGLLTLEYYLLCIS